MRNKNAIYLRHKNLIALSGDFDHVHVWKLSGEECGDTKLTTGEIVQWRTAKMCRAKVN